MTILTDDPHLGWLADLGFEPAPNLSDAPLELFDDEEDEPDENVRSGSAISPARTSWREGRVGMTGSGGRNLTGVLPTTASFM